MHNGSSAFPIYPLKQIFLLFPGLFSWRIPKHAPTSAAQPGTEFSRILLESGRQPELSGIPLIQRLLHLCTSSQGCNCCSLGGLELTACCGKTGIGMAEKPPGLGPASATGIGHKANIVLSPQLGIISACQTWIIFEETFLISLGVSHGKMASEQLRAAAAR